jgi:hypothetical protein
MAPLLNVVIGSGTSVASDLRRESAGVELRGRLSNLEAAQAVALADRAVGGGPVDGASTNSPPRESRPWRLVDRLDDQIHHRASAERSCRRHEGVAG